MNFLLHRHFAERELGEPAAGVGAMLPDLWRMADRRVRPARGAPDVAREDHALASGPAARVLDGVQHHIAIDRWFHACAVFRDGEREAAARIRAAAVAAPRMALFAHVIWEMCLDGALVRREGLGAVLASLRAGFAEAGGAAADRAADLHHFDRVARDDGARPAFDQRMRRLREEIARGPWIEGYQDGDGLAVRVAGVRARLGFEPLEPHDHRRLAGALAGLAREASPALEALSRERERALAG